MIHGPPLPSFAPAKAGKVRATDSNTLPNKSSISDVAVLFGRIRKPWKSSNPVVKRPSSAGNEEQSVPKSIVTEGIIQVYSRNSQDPALAGMVVSNPCFHPLRQKLSPRIEPGLKRHPTKGSISPVSGSSTRTPFNRGHAGNSLSGSTYGAAQESPTPVPKRNTRIDALMQGDRTSSQEQISLSELLAREEYDSRQLRRQEFGSEITRPTSTRSRPRSTKTTSNSSTRYRARLTSVPGRHQVLQPNAVAVALARGDHVKKFTWDKYLDQYSKGAFNMCSPPNPEIAEDDITYLPAVFPHDEAARLSVSQHCDALWSECGAPYAQEFVDQATSFFDVSFAAISFFDEKREIFKAQREMDSDGVFGRPYSMTAHALYTMDVFVVTDTKQDWRFRKNPWVDEWPGVRFVAVAPMIVDDHVIGTFAIMDKHPRPVFSYEDRRHLADFADAAIKEVKEKYELQKQAASYRHTPILERDSVVYGNQDEYTYPSSTKSGLPLAITKTMTIQQTMTERPVSQDELTPPSSADESRPFNQSALAPHISTQYVFPLPPRTLTGSLSMTSRPYSVSDLSSVHDNPAPTPQLQDRLISPCPVSELTPERFFGLTDRELYEPSIMSSLDNRASPRKTKKSVRQSRSEGRLSMFDSRYEDWSAYERSQQHEEAMSQLDASDAEGEEFAGPLDVVVKDTFSRQKPGYSPDKYSQHASHSPKDGRHGVCPGPPPTSALPPIPPSLLPSPVKGNTPHHSPPIAHPTELRSDVQLSVDKAKSPQPSPRVVCARNGLRYSTTDHHANLTSVCANIANSLNYDLVYVVELSSLATSNDNEKAQMQTKILSHYPLVNPDTIAVSLAQHLEALRKTISIFTSSVSAQQVANTHPALRGYQFGVLLSLNTPEPYDDHVTGTVLGAFKSTTSSLLVAEERKPGSDMSDVENLKKFIKDFALEELLHQIGTRSAVQANALEVLSEEEYIGLEKKSVGLGINTSSAASSKRRSGRRTRRVQEEVSYSDDDEIF